MTKLTVQKYAHKIGISPTAVYKQVKNGTVNSVIENGKTFVLTDDIEIKPSIEHDNKNDCMKMVTKLLKENKKLTNKVIKEADKRELIYQQFIHEMKNLYLPPVNHKDKNIGDKKKKKKLKKGGKIK